MTTQDSETDSRAAELTIDSADETVSLRGRAGWVFGRGLWWAQRAAWRLWRAVSWVFRSKWRLLVSAWLMGFFLVGQASSAAADGLINGPDLGTAGGQTVFERFGPEKFDLYLRLSDSHHGGLGIEESMWTILHAVENGLMYLIAALARGAITSMQWMFNLTLYSDNQQSIDSAVSGVASAVFWPLFGTTLAIGAMVAYGRMKREGGGSLWNDASWLIAASVFAAMFATAPSLVLKDMDNARTLISDGLMTGYAKLGPVGQSSAGFPPVTLPQDQNGAVRELSDGMWNTFVVTPWCYANFNDMSICRDVGSDYLTDSPRWQQLDHWMAGAPGSGGNTDDTRGAYCPKELNAQCDWIRGQSFGRLGALLFILIVTIPLVLMLLALVLYGLMAIFGFLLLALAGIVFLLFWMIPGRPRQIGVRWLEELIGALLQSIIITTVIGSVMVLDSFLSLGIPKYGFFAVGIFTFATFVTGFRMRGRLENVVGMGAGSGSSPFSGYMAMRGVAGLGKALGRSAGKVGGLGAKGAAGTFRAGRAMGEGLVENSWMAAGPVRRRAEPTTQSRPLPENPRNPSTTRPSNPRPATGGPPSTGPGRSGRHSAARTGSESDAALAGAAAGTAATGRSGPAAATPVGPATSTTNGAASQSTAARNGRSASTGTANPTRSGAKVGDTTSTAVGTGPAANTPAGQSSPATGQRSGPGRSARVELYPSPPARSGMGRAKRPASATPPPRTPPLSRPLVSRPLPVNPTAATNPTRAAATPRPSPPTRPAGDTGRSTPAAPSSPDADRARQQPARVDRVGQQRPTPQPPSTPRPAPTPRATSPQPPSTPRTPRSRTSSSLPPPPPTRVRRPRPDEQERPK